MDATGERHVIAWADQLRHGLITRQRSRYRQNVADIARLGFRQSVIHVLMQRLVIQAIEMTMRIY
ncbi:hypothetical protein D3C80_2220610 [compost metagenome]